MFQKQFYYKFTAIFLAVTFLLYCSGRVQSAFAAIPTAPENGSLLDLDLRVFVAGKPINLILVEKDRQRLSVLEH
jgi:hypothetical protein